ncbi:MAG TPA: TetR family transcriptional regulator [Rhizomicrobium sp.]|nr:TetR family transcriptional regulator [Rhizomicrobium sp.]
MAKEALNAQDSSWQHVETREAILAAARNIVARDGVPGLSLDSVAEGAGFAPATIYAYFASKPDMLTNLLCDDVAAFARGMRESYPFEGDERPGAVLAFAVPETDARQVPPAEAVPASDAAGEIHDAPEEPLVEDVAAAGAAGKDTAEPDQAHVERAAASEASSGQVEAQADAVLENAAAQAETPPTVAVSEEDAAQEEPDTSEASSEPMEAGLSERNESGAAPPGELAEMRAAIARLEGRKVDAWLERRLRVFEKSLADIETRLAGVEAASNRAVSMVGDNLKSFAERAEALEKRQREAGDRTAESLEAAERKARGTAAEMRASLNDVYGRLEALEIARGIAVTPAPALDASWESPEPAPPEKADAPTPETDKPLTAAAETYLAAARRAAKTAAELAEMEKPKSLLPAPNMSWKRAAMILGACVALAIVLAIVGVTLSYSGSSHKSAARPAAAVPAHHAAVTRHLPTVKLAAAKPAAAKPAHPDMAVYRLTALASTGNADAELLLGLRMLDGDEVAEDDARAAQLLQQSAAQGNAMAQYWLGTLYDRGRGVARDPAAAWRWYQSAAKKGNVKAMYNLADADARGNGTKADTQQAAHWFWMAAMQGYVDAQYNLAVLYERGQGVPQSLINAYKWYAIAAAAGDKDSKASIDALKTQLRPNEVTSGERAAAAYKPNAPDPAANNLPAPANLPAE